MCRMNPARQRATAQPSIGTDHVKVNAIDTTTGTPQGDLVVGLVSLVGRNRLALVVFAASLTAGARSRARQACAESAAARWLARNARTDRHFLASLSILNRCAGQAGYRSLGRAAVRCRRGAAPLYLTLCGRTAPMPELLALSGGDGARVPLPGSS